jgi:hypothetical protein
MLYGAFSISATRWRFIVASTALDQERRQSSQRFLQGV